MKLHYAAALGLVTTALFSACSGAEETHSTRQAAVVSPDLVISQVYGGGGNSGATYQNDFVEIFNRGSSAVQLSGYSIQYAATASNFVNNNAGLAVDLPSFSLQPGQYFLIKLAGGVNGVALPTEDASGTTDMSASNGKVALVLTSSKLNACGSTLTPCTVGGWVDLVGYGTASQFEGAAATAALSSTKAALRNGGGCDDSGDNAADFTTPVPVPRNTASSLNVCAVDAGSDAADDSAIDAAVDSDDGGIIIVVDAAVDADLDGSFDADLDGSFDADLDGSFDADLDGSFDADLDGSFDADLDGSVDADLDGSVDADLDATADTGVDASVDASSDASSADASADASVDATVDAAVDASADAAVDASADATADATTDATADAAVDATMPDDPGTLAGGGCSCNEAGPSKSAPGSIGLTFAVAAVLLRRRRRGRQ